MRVPSNSACLTLPERTWSMNSEYDVFCGGGLLTLLSPCTTDNNTTMMTMKTRMFLVKSFTIDASLQAQIRLRLTFRHYYSW